MQNKRVFTKHKKYDIVTIIFVILLILTLGYNYFFGSEEKIYRICLTLGTILITRFIFSKIFLKESKFSYYCILAFIFSFMYVGNILNIYTVISFYDKILHLVSGVVIGLIGFIIFVYFNKENIQNIKVCFAIVFIMSFSIALAGVWEIWEFTTDLLFGFNSQNNSLVDTMLDIICGTIGGIISLIPPILYLKNKNNNFVQLMLKDIIN